MHRTPGPNTPDPAVPILAPFTGLGSCIYLSLLVADLALGLLQCTASRLGRQRLELAMRSGYSTAKLILEHRHERVPLVFLIRISAHPNPLHSSLAMAAALAVVQCGP